MSGEVWKAMYLAMVHGAAEADALLADTPENAAAKTRLRRAMQEAEERYLSAPEGEDDPS